MNRLALTIRLWIAIFTLLISNGLLAPGAAAVEKSAPLAGIQRVLFLGDSITYGGRFIELIEAYSLTRFPDRRVEFLNLGLPSETVSGLSEPGHANGEFPRPDLHERLGRVLAQTKPDLVIACYGMNDGIYMPFAPERFEKFMAKQILLHLGATDLVSVEAPAGMLAGVRGGDAVLKLVEQRQRLLKDSWLSATGHKRPGMNPGLALADAQKKAEELDFRIRKELR